MQTGKVRGTEVFETLAKIHTAMEDDGRINAAIKFLFPHEKQEGFRQMMRERFKHSRNSYHAWLGPHLQKQDASLGAFYDTLPGIFSK